MTAIVFAAGLLVGLAVGLRLKHHRFLTERRLRSAEAARVDAYNGQAFATDLAEVGPVNPPAGTVELYDQDALPVDPLSFAASVGREHAAERPPAMTGTRDVAAQDRELVDIHGLPATDDLGQLCDHPINGYGGLCNQPATRWLPPADGMGRRFLCDRHHAAVVGQGVSD